RQHELDLQPLPLRPHEPGLPPLAPHRGGQRIGQELRRPLPRLRRPLRHSLPPRRPATASLRDPRGDRPQDPPRPARRSVPEGELTGEEYEHLVESGAFPSEARLELVDGLVYQMSPQTSFHSTGVRAADEALRSVFAGGFDIRVQMPLALGEDSEPKP